MYMPSLGSVLPSPLVERVAPDRSAEVLLQRDGLWRLHGVLVGRLVRMWSQYCARGRAAWALHSSRDPEVEHGLGVVVPRRRRYTLLAIGRPSSDWICSLCLRAFRPGPEGCPLTMLPEEFTVAALSRPRRRSLRSGS